MRLLVQNDGELDLKLLELMGASTKDGVSTIGVFGTGWKYGLALALRKNIPVEIYSGSEHIKFSTMKQSVRDTDFDIISYSINGKRRTRTSMTTKMGEQDWNNEWMFLREVFSNALDEQGFIVRKMADDEKVDPEVGKTKVIIGLTEPLKAITDQLDLYIRRNDSIESNRYGSLLPSKTEKCRIYKQGIFVKELERSGLFDYDLERLTLTESRSADSWDIRFHIRELLNLSSIDTKKTIINRLIESVDCIEAQLDFDYCSSSEKDSWVEAYKNDHSEDVLCSDSEVSVTAVAANNKNPIRIRAEKLARVLREGTDVLTDDKLLGKGVTEGFAYRDASDYEAALISNVANVCSLLFGDKMLNLCDFKVFTGDSARSDEDIRILVESDKRLSVAINEETLGQGVNMTFRKTFEELNYFLNSNASPEFLDIREKVPVNLMEKVLPKLGFVF